MLRNELHDKSVPEWWIKRSVGRWIERRRTLKDETGGRFNLWQPAGEKADVKNLQQVFIVMDHTDSASVGAVKTCAEKMGWDARIAVRSHLDLGGILKGTMKRAQPERYGRGRTHLGPDKIEMPMLGAVERDLSAAPRLGGGLANEVDDFWQSAYRMRVQRDERQKRALEQSASDAVCAKTAAENTEAVKQFWQTMETGDDAPQTHGIDP